MIVRKLGTLQELLKEHGPTRDDVMEWAWEQARIETEKYKKEKEARLILIPSITDLASTGSAARSIHGIF